MPLAYTPNLTLPEQLLEASNMLEKAEADLATANARIAELEAGGAQSTTTAPAPSADVSALLSRVSVLEAENISLKAENSSFRSRGGAGASGFSSSGPEPVKVMIVPPPPAPSISSVCAQANGVTIQTGGAACDWKNKVYIADKIEPGTLTARAIAARAEADRAKAAKKGGR